MVITTEAAWVKDGAAVRRIDPATNQLGAPVALPVDGGQFRTSEAALYYGVTGATDRWFRLAPDDASFVDLGDLGVTFGDPVPGGGAIWFQGIDGAHQFLAPGGPQRGVAIGGTLVAADSSAVYTTQDTPVAGVANLWRHPIDGSASGPIAASISVPAMVGPAKLDYFEATMLFAPRHVVASWQVKPGIGQPTVVYVQVISLP
jgi:hypothetical protein